MTVERKFAPDNVASAETIIVTAGQAQASSNKLAMLPYLEFAAMVG